MEEHELSGSELVIMRCIWGSQEDLSMQELMETVKLRYGKDYKRTSIGTFITHMSEKGYVSTYRKGHLAFVHAEKTADEYRRKRAREETDDWFQGKASGYIAALFEENRITEEEADEIRRILDGMGH